MGQFNTPSKYQVRAWLINRRLNRTPLPSREQILLDMGWTTKEGNNERQDQTSQGHVSS